MVDFSVRRLQPGDSLDDLTSMLHRAFAPMARRGLDCQSTHQSADMTRRRAERGDCLVAVADRKIVGTLTLESPDLSSPIRRYRVAGIASIHQFGVDPGYQGTGIGHALLQVAAGWARARRFAELALDTPALAIEARSYYAGQGFELVDTAFILGRSYQSVILAKPLSGHARRSASSAWPARRVMGPARDCHGRQ